MRTSLSIFENAPSMGFYGPVWEKVKVLEKVAERFGEPFEHRLGEDEDREVREAAKTLYQVSEALRQAEEWAAFDEEWGED